MISDTHNSAASSRYGNDNLNYLKILIVCAVTLLISCSWLIFPYFVKGSQLLRDAGESSRIVKGGNVSQYYTRHLFQHAEIDISAVFATADFFRYVDDIKIASQLRPDKNFIFFVNESIHSGELGSELPEVELVIDENRYQPVSISAPSTATHHRVSIFSFAKRDNAGNEINLDDSESISLRVTDQWLDVAELVTFTGAWSAPFDLPEELEARTGITLVAVLAIGAGLLSSVLTPCLLQIVAFFGSTLGGFATLPHQGVTTVDEITPIIQRKIRQVTMAFVIGLVFLYVMAGALIGAVGYQAQLVFAEYSRLVAIISGVFVIMLGIWVGLRGTSRFSCKLPDTTKIKGMSFRDSLGSVALSMGYALGCTACFGGAIVATLIVYVGTIGSASIGAGIMFIFSMGVALPFLLAAYYASKMNSLLTFLVLKQSLLSKISMVLIILFGLILVTDNFHTLSDFIYPYLGLG